jgi:hypothetical protein
MDTGADSKFVFAFDTSLNGTAIAASVIPSCAAEFKDCQLHSLCFKKSGDTPGRWVSMSERAFYVVQPERETSSTPAKIKCTVDAVLEFVRKVSGERRLSSGNCEVYIEAVISTRGFKRSGNESNHQLFGALVYALQNYIDGLEVRVIYPSWWKDALGKASGVKMGKKKEGVEDAVFRLYAPFSWSKGDLDDHLGIAGTSHPRSDFFDAFAILATTPPVARMLDTPAAKFKVAAAGKKRVRKRRVENAESDPQGNSSELVTTPATASTPAKKQKVDTEVVIDLTI